MSSVSQVPNNHYLTASSVRGLGLLVDNQGRIINKIVLKDHLYRIELITNPFKKQLDLVIDL